MPQINELESLVDASKYNQALPEGHPFTNVQAHSFWSSTTVASNTALAWDVVMFNGVVGFDGKGYVYYVWPVRAGQSGAFGNSYVWKTGQTTSYAAGDDGDLKMGVAWPSPRFTDNGNGTVSDGLTGLIWLKNANCFGTKIWNDALTAANTLANGQCGLSDGSGAGDWRLPNRKELMSLVDASKYNPALPAGHPFTNVQSDVFWSSSTYANLTGDAWVVDVHDGGVGYGFGKSYGLYVWPVRGGTVADTTPPTGTISINSGVANTNSTSVTLTLSCSDASGCAEMQFSNDNTNYSTAEAYATSKSWTLTSVAGTKTVYVKFKDNAGNWSGAVTNKMLVLVRNAASLDSEETKVTNFLTQNGYQYDLADSSTIAGGLNVGSYKVLYFRTGAEPTGYNQANVLNAIKGAVEAGSSLFVEYYGNYLAQYLGWGSITSPVFSPVVYDKLAYVKPITSHEIFNGISTWDPPSSPDKTEQLIWSLNNTGSYTCKDLSITGEQKIEFWHLHITYGWPHLSTSSSYCQSWGGCTSERSVFSDSIRYATHGLGKLIQPPAVGIGGQSNGNAPVTLGQAGTSLMKNLLNWSGAYLSAYSDTIALDTTTPPTTTASPAGGTYSAQSVTLLCSDSGSGCANIYYTTDGSTPTTSSSVYSGPINISTTTTLKFFAKDNAGNSESVKTETYTISTVSNPTTLVSGLTNPYYIAVDATSAYWTESSSGTVKKVGINGGSITTLASGMISPQAIAVDATSVYFVEAVNTTGTVKKVGINGGTVTTLASGLDGPIAIAVDSTSVYWTEYNGGNIKKVGINGGSVTTLATGTQSVTHPVSIAVDSTYVYWTERGNNGSDGAINKVGINGGSKTTLVSGLNYPSYLAIDSTSVYWIQDNIGTIKKIGKDGGTVTQLASGLTQPSGISVDATGVYFVESITNTGNLKKVGLDGGTVTTLASWLNNPAMTAVDSTYIYWTENNSSGAIKKLGKSAAIQLPRTGQTTSYAAGDDGAIQAGVAWPSPRFTDNSDQTITDNLTGLMWTKDAGTPTAGSCTGGAKTWQGALDYVACLNSNNYLSHNDWRLPQRNELESLVDASKYQPALPAGHPFSNGQSVIYWSSSTYAFGAVDAWYVSMNGGYVNGGGKSSNLLYVWPVRAGQSGSFGNSYIWKTGQTTSYATGDDGDLEMGVAWPNPRFTDNGNGTVTDNLTGLIWLKNANCFGTKTWTDALTASNTLSNSQCGLSDGSGAGDWRLPNRKELMSLVDASKYNPALPEGYPFTSVQSNYYWSSSTYADVTGYAWYVSMGFGYVSGAISSSNYYVWPVRAGTVTGPSDTTPPTGSISINSGATYTTSTSATLTLSCSDANGCSQMQFSNDNVTYSTAETYSTSKLWTLTSGDGTKTVYVKFKDTAGNWSTATISDTIVLDTTPPSSFTIGLPADGATVNKPYPYFSWNPSTDSGSGITKYQLYIDGSLQRDNIINWTAAVPSTALPNGSHTWFVRAWDEAGNYRDSVTRNLTVNSGMGKIAFVSDRDAYTEIHTMNVDGSNVNRLTDNLALDWEPAFSADGSKIAFTSGRDINNQIYIMNADGTNQINISNNSVNDNGAAFSPDGSKIVFASVRDGETDYEIFLMNADGSGQTRLTENTAADMDPVFSPDGSKIAFTSQRDGNYEIYLMNSDGNNQTRLTNNPAFDRIPAFSPDGSKIAFSSDRDTGSENIYIMDADGGNQTKVTNNGGGLPSYSPDGSKIVFYSAREGNAEIYVMNSDGTNQTNLSNSAAWDSDPSWGPSAPLSSDTTPPTGSISINSGAASTNSTSVTLTLTCTDASGCSQMQFSNDNVTYSTAETYATSKAWTLTSGDGTKTVYAKFKDTAGNWSGAYSDTITLDGPPSAPSSIEVNQNGVKGELVITWTKPTDSDLNHIHIYRSTTSGVLGSLIADNQTGIKYTDTGLASQTTYYYTVRSVDNAGNESTNTNTQPNEYGKYPYAATPDFEPPLPPTNISASDAGTGGKINLSWTILPQSDFSHIHIYRSTAGGTLGNFVYDNITGTSKSDTGLVNGLTYYYVIRSVDASGNESTNTLQAYAAPTAPDVTAPGAVSSVNISDPATGGALNISWANPADSDFAKVRIYRSTTSGQLGSLVHEVTGTSVSDTGLTSGTTYYYTFRTVDNLGNESTHTTQYSGMPTDIVAPNPVTELTATLLIGGKVQLDWIRSSSEDINYYNIYYDNGTGTIDYNTAIASIQHPTVTWTSDALTVGIRYQFAIRAEDTSLNKETNTNVISVVPVTDPDAGDVSASIKVPQTGKKVCGNKVTVVAELLMGTVADTQKIRLQYKAVASGTWSDIPSTDPAKFPNPDTTSPYFVHWNVTGLADGAYNLRAVATSNTLVTDSNPSYITITVDSVNCSSQETTNAGNEKTKVEDVSKNASSTSVMAGLITTGITTLTLPEGALNADTKINITESAPATKNALVPSGYSSGNSFNEIGFESGQSTLSNNKKATVEIPYKDTNDDGIVDGTSVKVYDLQVCDYDSGTGKWTCLDSTIDTTNKTIKAKTEKFSLFGLLMPPKPIGTAWNMLSVPLQPSPNTPSAVFGSVTNYTNYVLRWNPTSEQYYIVSSINTGEGYLVWGNGNNLGTVSGTETPNANFSISIKKGWNMIGHPFRYKVNVSDLWIFYGGNYYTIQDAETNGWVVATVYKYENGAYQFQTAQDEGVLEAWKGYWILSDIECTLIVPPMPAQ